MPGSPSKQRRGWAVRVDSCKPPQADCLDAILLAAIEQAAAAPRVRRWLERLLASEQADSASSAGEAENEGAGDDG